MAMTQGPHSKTHSAEAAPMSDLNTTPLIDVMLVLLIMFIITIPIQSHAVKIDLPTAGALPETLDPVRNKIVILEAGTIVWNGEPVSFADLETLLDLTTQIEVEPELHLQPEGDAPYDVVDHVIAATKRAGVTKVGFVGNEAYSTAF
ncbi:biopolymer transporter ExbD [Sphingomicrobium sp. XHP0235]|uniref:ExbD/TolR family protein n=1 Tax=Sphingomicrobium aquimarinum TaxID=3133971 RepID=UPI0031FE5330